MSRTEYSIDTLVLSGSDSISFYNSFFRPTKEELIESKRRLDRIRTSVRITFNDEGMLAEVDDLDLSFLDDVVEKIVVQKAIKVSMNSRSPVFTPCEAKPTLKTEITINRNSGYEFFSGAIVFRAA